MHKLVKNVFLMLLGCVVALILYFVFFGVNLTPYGNWEGLIYYSARAIETPISRYYYEYCYLPSMHSNDAIDKALNGVNTVYDIQQTPTDLTHGVDVFSFSTTPNHYSTGWQ